MNIISFELPDTTSNVIKRRISTRIKVEFDECKVVNKDYRTMTIKRSQKAMSKRWVIIQTSVNMFHGYHNEVETRGDGGADISDVVCLFLR
jgi:hypothetical protein